MKELEFMKLLGELPAEYIEAASHPQKIQRRFVWLRYGLPAMAACIAIVIFAAVYPRLQTPDIPSVNSQPDITVVTTTGTTDESAAETHTISVTPSEPSGSQTHSSTVQPDVGTQQNSSDDILPEQTEPLNPDPDRTEQTDTSPSAESGSNSTQSAEKTSSRTSSQTSRTSSNTSRTSSNTSRTSSNTSRTSSNTSRTSSQTSKTPPPITRTTPIFSDTSVATSKTSTYRTTIQTTIVLATTTARPSGTVNTTITTDYVPSTSEPETRPSSSGSMTASSPDMTTATEPSAPPVEDTSVISWQLYNPDPYSEELDWSYEILNDLPWDSDYDPLANSGFDFERYDCLVLHLRTNATDAVLSTLSLHPDNFWLEGAIYRQASDRTQRHFVFAVAIPKGTVYFDELEHYFEITDDPSYFYSIATNEPYVYYD